MRLNIFGYVLTIETVKQMNDPLHWTGQKAKEFQLRVRNSISTDDVSPKSLKIPAIKAVRKISTELGYPLPSLADTKKYVEDVMRIL